MGSLSANKLNIRKRVTLILNVLLYFFFAFSVSYIDRNQIEVSFFGIEFDCMSICGIIIVVNCLQLLWIITVYKRRGFYLSAVLCAFRVVMMAIPVIKYKETSIITGISVTVLNFITLCVVYKYMQKMECTQCRLQEQADTDALTELPNMRALKKKIKFFIENYDEFALVFIDLDDFKMINDISGHNCGDNALRFISGEWKKVLSPDDYLVRIGGDEFALLVPAKNGKTEAINHIFDISSMTNENMGMSYERFRVTASFGIAFYPQDGRDYATLLSCADTAMYSSKQYGKSKITEYKDGMTSNLLLNHEKEQLIRDAFENDKFFMMFQPQYNAKTRELRGFESLIRINRNGGVVYPGEFMGIAEKNGMILNIDRWVIKNVMENFSELLEKTGTDIVISINVSALHLLDKCFIDDLKDAMEQTGFPAKCLEIEVTESICLKSVEHAVSVLNELNDMGISLAIDDFGTGYASLSYLSKLPVHMLKIDKSFIDGIASDSRAGEIVQAIVSMGHILKLDIIAEGVESEEQVNVLNDIGCDYIQGYVWDKPVTEEISKSMVKKLA